MTDQNLKNDANLTTSHQSDESTAEKALFISEWKVDAGEKLYFPTQGREGTIVIDWGDGSSDTISSGDDAYISHEYSKGGVYTIKVDGMITKWSCEFDSDDDDRIRSNSKKLIRILSYGKTSFGPYTFKHASNLTSLPENESPRFFENSMKGVFYGASSFNQSINHWNTSNVTNMHEMFHGAESFNKPLNDWNTSNVTDMSEMFSGASSFDQPLNDWNTSNVTDMNAMFYGAWSFNQPLNDWDTSNVTDMSQMFSGAKNFDQPLNDWDTSNVTDMSQMFEDTEEFNQPLNDWNTSNVTDMGGMFTCAEKFNQPLNDWDTSNVTRMGGMFYYAEEFNQPLNKWNTSNVNIMCCMFNGAKSFNQPLNDWNTSNVTDMSGMFTGAHSFNKPLNDWNTSNVTDMSEMFSGASSFDQPLNDWNTSNVTDMHYMFQFASLFDQPLDKWDVSNVTDMNGMFDGAMCFNQPLDKWGISDVTDLSEMIDDEDASNADEMFTSVWRVDSNESLFFPIQGREGEIVIDWGDGSSDTINSGDDEYISHDYDEDGFYIIKVDGMITKWSCDLDLGEGCYDEDADDEEDYTDINSHKLIKILSYGKTSFGPYAFMRACNLVGLPRFESPRFFEGCKLFCVNSQTSTQVCYKDTGLSAKELRHGRT